MMLSQRGHHVRGHPVLQMHYAPLVYLLHVLLNMLAGSPLVTLYTQH